MERIAFRAMTRTAGDLELFANAFGRNRSARTVEHLRWQYFDNPVPGLYVQFAVDEANDRLAAIYAVVPVRARVGGRVIQAAQSLNTLTDRDYRGRGLFVGLANRVYQICEDAGFGFVYGFPNRNSVHGFRNRLGWRSLDPVPRMVRPLSSDYYLRRAPLLRSLASVRRGAVSDSLQLPSDGRGKIRALDGFGAETDELWTEFSRSIGTAVERTSCYMDWRFISKPGQNYSVLGCYDGHRLVALVVFTLMSTADERTGYIMELLHRPGDLGLALLLLRQALVVLRRSGCSAALCWCLRGSPNYPVYRRAGFIGIPAWLSPTDLHFGVRPFGSAGESDLCDRNSWYVSCSDLDTV